MGDVFLPAARPMSLIVLVVLDAVEISTSGFCPVMGDASDWQRDPFSSLSFGVFWRYSDFSQLWATFSDWLWAPYFFFASIDLGSAMGFISDCQRDSFLLMTIFGLMLGYGRHFRLAAGALSP